MNVFPPDEMAIPAPASALTGAFTAYPAIDVRNGRVVRLAQGDYARETRYDADPYALAMRYADAGAGWLHLVDLEDSAGAAGLPRRRLRHARTLWTSSCPPVAMPSGLRIWPAR